MSILRLMLISCALFGATYCQSTVKVLPQPITISVSTTGKTTPITPTTPSTKPTTPSTTPTTPSTTPTTPSTTPTTPSTTPTTPSTTPTTPSTSPTTKPTTVPTKPTSPPAPQPIPDPQMGNWTVTYPKSNRTCIVVDIAVQFEVLQSGSNNTLKVNLPKNATASGECEKDDQKLTLSWDNNTNSLTFDFIRTNTSKFLLQNVSSTLFLNLKGKESKKYSLIHNQSEFSTPLTKSYKCARVQTLNLTEKNLNVTFAYLHVSHAQFQAFKNVSGNSFGSAMDCEAAITSDIVPIVVGCVLTILVVMVLIGYFVGRHCQTRGYLSM